MFKEIPYQSFDDSHQLFIGGYENHGWRWESNRELIAYDAGWLKGQEQVTPACMSIVRKIEEIFFTPKNCDHEGLILCSRYLLL